MRLVCPTCDAEYEIARAAIPRSGRQVECSNCGHAWFQAFADLRIDEAEPIPAAEDALADATPDVPRPVDNALLEVLRQEAAREVKARLSEVRPPDSHPPVVELQIEMPLARSGGGGEHLRALKNAGDIPPLFHAPGPRQDGSRAVQQDFPPPSTWPDLVPQRVRPKVPSGPSPWVRFMLLLILAGALLLALYVFAPLIAEKVPSLSKLCADYVDFVDRAVMWAQNQAHTLLDWAQSTGRQVAR